jgi:hypothetical protein
MKWLRKKPFFGNKRIKRKFLMFPKMICSQWRWLEIAEWEEVFGRFWLYHPRCPVRLPIDRWQATQWLDIKSQADLAANLVE